MPDGIIIADATRQVVLGNEQVERLLGVRFAGGDIGGYRPRGRRPDGTEYGQHDWPLARSLRTGEIVEREEIELLSPGGDRRVIVASSAPIRTEEGGGEIVGAVVSIQDVTERKRVEERLQLLADVGSLLDAPLDVEERLRRVARLTIPRLADWCSIDLLEGDRVRSVAVVHRDPARERSARELRERHPTDLSGAHGVPAVLRSGLPALYPEVGEEVLRAIAGGEEHLAALRALGMTSAVIVPLSARGRVLGALTLVAAESGQRYTEDDVALVLQLARRAAVGVDNARLYERAVRLQEATAALAASLSTEDVAAVILREACLSLDAKGGVLSLLNEERNALDVVLTIGIDEDRIGRFRRMPLAGRHAAADAVRTGRPLWIETTEDWRRRYPLAHDIFRGFAACSAVLPFVVGDRAVGAIGLVFAAERTFTPEDRVFALTLAKQCAQAIERGRLYAAEQTAATAALDSARRARLLADVTSALELRPDAHGRLEALVRLLAGRLGESATVTTSTGEGPPRMVAAAGPEDQRPRREALVHAGSPAPAQGYVAQVLATGEAVLLPRIPDEPGSLIVVPLTRRTRTFAALSLMTTRSEAGLTEADLELAEEIARRAALAIDNAELSAAEEAARRRVARIQHVTAELARALDRDEVARIGVEQGLGAVGARAASIALLTADGRGLEPRWTAGLPQQAATEYRVIPLDAPLATAEAARTAAPVFVAGVTEREARYPSRRRVFGEEFGGIIAVPLLARGETVGTLTFGFGAEARLAAEDLAAATTVSQLTAQALERAELYETEHEIAAVLQRSLLPAELPLVAGLDAAARYLPAAGEGVEAGGDWYEVIRLPGGRAGVAVGDVVGRGARAAAVMGQLRSALRMALLDGHAPAAALARLDRFAAATPGAEAATAAVAVLDPATGTLRYACAGHPPPLVVGADGAASFLTDGRSPPLASVAGARFGEGGTVMAPGATLLLYTDGVVERRDESIDAGLDRLGALARRTQAAGSDVAELCSALIDGVFASRPAEDDAALLAVRRSALRPDLRRSGIPGRSA